MSETALNTRSALAAITLVDLFIYLNTRYSINGDGNIQQLVHDKEHFSALKHLICS